MLKCKWNTQLKKWVKLYNNLKNKQKIEKAINLEYSFYSNGINFL